MTQRQLKALLDQHAIPDVDRPALLALVGCGKRPSPRVIRKLHDGDYTGFLDAVFEALTPPTSHAAMQRANSEKLVILYRETRKRQVFEFLRNRHLELIAGFVNRRGGRRGVVNRVFRQFLGYCRSELPITNVQGWLIEAAWRETAA